MPLSRAAPGEFMWRRNPQHYAGMRPDQLSEVMRFTLRRTVTFPGAVAYSRVASAAGIAVRGSIRR